MVIEEERQGFRIWDRYWGFGTWDRYWGFGTVEGGGECSRLWVEDWRLKMRG